MPTDRVLLSIVCPAYEEEQVLGPFHAALSDARLRPSLPSTKSKSSTSMTDRVIEPLT